MNAQAEIASVVLVFDLAVDKFDKAAEIASVVLVVMEMAGRVVGMMVPGLMAGAE